MTVSDVAFDTWAWFEILHGTVRGARLRRRYLRNERVRIHTSSISLAEVASRLARDGQTAHVGTTLAWMEREATVHDIGPLLAREAGLAHAALRTRHPDASLADAIVLATARRTRAPLVSDDSAFEGLPDVRKN